MGVVLRKRGAMEDLCNELLELVLKRLPLRDAVRARVVCRRWRDRIDAEQFHFQSSRCRSYCPLVFKRTDDGQHTWWGYNNATGQWDPLPSLSHVPRSISFLPFVGNQSIFLSSLWNSCCAREFMFHTFKIGSVTYFFFRASY